MTPRTTIDADVVIVGAGVVGCAIAWRLSKHDLRVVVVERHHDVGCEASSANNGIIGAGWALPRGSLISRLTVAANVRWDELSDQLCIPFRRCGSIVLARSEEESGRIPEMIGGAKSMGVAARRVDPGEIAKLAPHATPHVFGGMLIPSEGIVDSPRATIAYAELAETNGVRFFFREPLIGARRDKERVREIFTPNLCVRAKYVVSAAGLGGDEVSRMLGCEEFQMVPRRGEYLVFDREVGSRVTCTLKMMPTPTTHGLVVVPTVHGGLLVGPTADDVDDKTDVSSHREVLERVLAEGRGLMPDLDERFVIKSYAGNRPHSPDGLYRIEPSERAPNMIQVAAIRSIGVTSSPALADYVFDLLVEQGLRASVRRNARDRLDRPKALFETLDCESAAKDPLGRTIVCACEKVTAAEIHAALQAPLPACSISGIAHRTHATYGRCQGATCAAGVALIASLYRKGEAWEVPVGEPEATLGVGKARRV